MKKLVLGLLMSLLAVNCFATTTASVTSHTANTTALSATENTNNSNLANAINTHNAATTGEHGVTGTIVGTSDTQTLTNKTLTSPTMTSPTITGTGAAAFSTVTLSSATVVTGGTVTTNTPPLSITQTWNGSQVHTGIKQNITDTASHSNSLLLDLQINGTSCFKIDKSGEIFNTSVGTAATAEIARFLNSGVGLGRGIVIRGTAGGYPCIDAVLTTDLTSTNLVLNNNGADIFRGDDGASFDQVSDIRIKDNIKPLSPMLDKLKLLKAVTFKFKQDGIMGHIKETRIGFIADDVEKVFPEWVKIGEDKQHLKLLNMEGINAVLIKAIQEQQVKIDSLEKRIEKLEAK